jgi:Restriction endonuclease EcoRV
MPANAKAMTWLRNTVAKYDLDLVAVLRKQGVNPSWPLKAKDPDDLVAQLAAGGHLIPLPKEPAALANVLEVSLVDFILAEAQATRGVHAIRGTERGYPDIELSGPAFGGGHHAVDIKNARRNKSGRGTQSPITLYTGNTYFRYPTLLWPGTFRPFADYQSHIDLLGIYTFDESLLGRIRDLDLIVQEPWRIASKQRSSSTREYIGAVKKIDDLRDGNGAFVDEKAFYTYWRKFRFKIGPTVQAQLDKLLAASSTKAPAKKKP